MVERVPLVLAHQRHIAEAERQADTAERHRSLDGYSVETVSRAAALSIIMRYEWLGTPGRTTLFAGLLSPARDLHGVVCFGHGPAGNIRGLIGAPAYCLERGACVHNAPANAASFLIAGACKLVYRLTGVEIFFAYADPSAGEYGAVYQAANWVYLGQGLDGRKGRARRFMVLPPGLDPDNPGNWKTTREFRRAGRRMSFAEARAAGWQIGWREAKHVYAMHVGPRRGKWRKAIPLLPYPAPRPNLKRRN